LVYSRKHSYLPHIGNWKLISLLPSDVVIHLLYIRNKLFLPLDAEIFSLGEVECGSFLEQPFIVREHTECWVVANIWRGGDARGGEGL
jgi:hypothetical protein